MRVTSGIAVVLASSTALAMIWPQGRQEPKKTPNLAAFKSWRKVNDKPYPMTSEAWTLCRMPTPRELRAGRFAAIAKPKTGPHVDKWVTVWVNDEGKEAMLKGSAFPVGSAIVKEKTDVYGSHSNFATAMIKRKRGYNPDCGDWEFATLSLPEAKITQRGKLLPCMNCHKARAKEDFTFRPYVGGSSKRKG